MSALDLFRPKARSWLSKVAVPLWSSAGVDRRGGGFFERLDFAGEGDARAAKRLRVQARQIYVMSHAHLLGFGGREALPAAEFGFAFMTRRGWAEEGGFVQLLSREGACLDARRDTYDHAFVLLALAWYFRATGDEAVHGWIDRTLAFLDRALWDEVTGSFREQVPPALPRRQNPHMHLLEAFLALFEATGEERFLARARTMVRLFERRFFESRTGTLREFFDDAWVPAEGLEGRVREPGHHFEWVWLLSEFERLTGDPVTAYRAPLFALGAGPGTEPATGLVYDAVREDGAVHQATKRCWPQTEALKACLVVGDEARGARVLDNLFRHYLDTRVPGLWVDQLGARNEPLSTNVPASTLYHLFVALVAASAPGELSGRAARTQ